MDCEFCAIAGGDIEAHRLYETEHVLAFLDENPAAEGHVVVLPKPHREELLGTGEATTGAVFDAVDTVAGALREALDPDGFSVFYTSGPLMGNVEHAHIHLVPREDGDDISVAIDRDPLDPEAAEALASAVRRIQ